jgi:conjugal transfer pilus assembly protein TraB
VLQNLSEKQKQALRIGAVVAVLLVIFIGSSYMAKGKGDGKSSTENIQKRKKMSLFTDKVEKDLWVAAEGQNIKALEKSNEELKSEFEKFRRELDDVKKKSDKERGRGKEADSPPVPLQSIVPPPADTPMKQVVGPSSFPPQMVPPPGSPARSGGAPGPSAVDPHGKEQSPVPGSSIKVFKDEEVKSYKDKVKDKKNKKDKTAEAWLPSGSFMKAVLLNGLDAPTSGTSQAEPYPVVMMVKDIAILPNRFKMNLSECFIIGAGYGNLSDERAYIRTENLSCITRDGKAIDIALKGHVIGEDGKLGVRGRLVSKQGQQIAMAVFAGTLAGFGSALKPQQALSINLNPSSTSAGVVNPDVETIFEGAGLEGGSTALNKVADYYLKLAEKIFPVIEVDAGREVEIAILKGQELKKIAKK